MNLILMGPPGVGKGTQGALLSSLYGVPVVASGDMFRKIRQEDTPRAREIRSYMDRGDYVPDSLTIGMVLDRLNEPDARKGFILDGFPRTVPQAQALDVHLTAEGRPIQCVVLLHAPAAVILERLVGRRICSNCGRVYNEQSSRPKVSGICDACGGEIIQRTDEAPDVQRKRLGVYERQTAPVAAYYEASGRLKTVNAARPVDDVEAELLQYLGEGTAACP